MALLIDRTIRAAAHLAAALATAAVLALAPGAANAGDASLEYAVKANFLYKFGPFVDWPATVCISSGDDRSARPRSGKRAP